MTSHPPSPAPSPASIEDGWRAARRDLPTIDLPLEVFEAYVRDLVARVPARAPRVWSDVYLACACRHDVPGALARFAAISAPTLESIRQRFGQRAPSADELRSLVLDRLFVSADGARPKIEEYAGEAPLTAWLRVVALRLLLNAQKARAPDEPVDDSILDALVTTVDNPELSYARAERRALVRAALAQATADLEPRARKLIRLSFVERLTIDDVAQLYDVHRATAARWVKRACEDLASGVTRIVRAEMNLTADEYVRWAGSVAQSLHASVLGEIDLTGEDPSDEPSAPDHG